MTALRFDITAFLRMTEGQHFERKSLFKGEPDKKKPRDRKDVRDQIAECVAAFANAEGGVAIFGIEDDASVTGHKYPTDAVDEMLSVPSSRTQPPQANGFRIEHEGKELLVFEVAVADSPVMVTGNGYPLRVGDKTVKMEEPKIRALKLEGLAESWVNRPSRMTIADLNQARLGQAKGGAGYPDITDEEYLLRRKLADRKGAGLVLRRAAELLFANEPDHPNAGIRIFRILGTERRVGTNYNVEERPRIEGPLPVVLDGAFTEIAGLLRKPSRLRGTRFKETPEYPEFAWREAILNAVAHRDYGNQGRSIEVSLFDDHLEVSSPGALLPEIHMDTLRARQRVHQSRNPRLVRALVDLGFMRDQGEGIPRLFAEMEGLFLPAPDLESAASLFRVTLLNTPTLTTADGEFIGALGSEELTDLEFRALLEASRHSRVDNARMREIAGLDTLGASKLLRGLRDRKLLVLQAAGSSTYYELSEGLRTSGGLVPNGGGLDAEWGGVREQMGGSSGANGGGLSPEQRRLVEGLGKKPRAEKLRPVIESLLSERWWASRELAAVLNRDVGSLVEDHLSPMVHEGRLERSHTDPSHPALTYRTVIGPLFSKQKKGVP
ncbi:MAG: ATP-binding protein [Polyangiaceae bacterium]|nr:ATP-binding protein [Polyangiaceae bacterium]